MLPIAGRTKFTLGAARGGTTWSRSEVEADLRASISIDDTDREETEELIGRLFALPVVHLGWYVRGVRDRHPSGEVFQRP